MLLSQRSLSLATAGLVYHSCCHLVFACHRVHCNLRDWRRCRRRMRELTMCPMSSHRRLRDFILPSTAAQSEAEGTQSVTRKFILGHGRARVAFLSPPRIRMPCGSFQSKRFAEMKKAHGRVHDVFNEFASSSLRFHSTEYCGTE